MPERWYGLGGASVEKPHQDVLELLQDNFGETLDVYKSRGGEYAIRTETVENLVIDIKSRSMSIIDIEVRNPDSGDGKRMVGALIETAKEFGFELWARNVRPELDSWWRGMGFAPAPGDEHSADYVCAGTLST